MFSSPLVRYIRSTSSVLPSNPSFSALGAGLGSNGASLNDVSLVGNLQTRSSHLTTLYLDKNINSPTRSKLRQKVMSEMKSNFGVEGSQEEKELYLQAGMEILMNNPDRDTIESVVIEVFSQLSSNYTPSSTQEPFFNTLLTVYMQNFHVEDAVLLAEGLYGLREVPIFGLNKGVNIAHISPSYAITLLKHLLNIDAANLAISIPKIHYSNLTTKMLILLCRSYFPKLRENDHDLLISDLSELSTLVFRTYGRFGTPSDELVDRLGCDLNSIEPINTSLPFYAVKSGRSLLHSVDISREERRSYSGKDNLGNFYFPLAESAYLWQIRGGQWSSSMGVIPSDADYNNLTVSSILGGTVEQWSGVIESSGNSASKTASSSGPSVSNDFTGLLNTFLGELDPYSSPSSASPSSVVAVEGQHRNLSNFTWSQRFNPSFRHTSATAPVDASPVFDIPPGCTSRARLVARVVAEILGFRMTNGGLSHVPSFAPARFAGSLSPAALAAAAALAANDRDVLHALDIAEFLRLEVSPSMLAVLAAAARASGEFSLLPQLGMHALSLLRGGRAGVRVLAPVSVESFVSTRAPFACARTFVAPVAAPARAAAVGLLLDTHGWVDAASRFAQSASDDALKLESLLVSLFARKAMSPSGFTIGLRQLSGAGLATLAGALSAHVSFARRPRFSPSLIAQTNDENDTSSSIEKSLQIVLGTIAKTTVGLLEPIAGDHVDTTVLPQLMESIAAAVAAVEIIAEDDLLEVTKSSASALDALYPFTSSSSSTINSNTNRSDFKGSLPTDDSYLVPGSPVSLEALEATVVHRRETLARVVPLQTNFAEELEHSSLNATSSVGASLSDDLAVELARSYAVLKDVRSLRIGATREVARAAVATLQSSLLSQKAIFSLDNAVVEKEAALQVAATTRVLSAYIRSLAVCGDLRAAVAVARSGASLGCRFTESVFSAIISCAVTTAEIPVVMDALRVMVKLGIVPTRITFKSLAGMVAFVEMGVPSVKTQLLALANTFHSNNEQEAASLKNNSADETLRGLRERISVLDGPAPFDLSSMTQDEQSALALAVEQPVGFPEPLLQLVSGRRISSEEKFLLRQILREKEFGLLDSVAVRLDDLLSIDAGEEGGLINSLRESSSDTDAKGEKKKSSGKPLADSLISSLFSLVSAGPKDAQTSQQQEEKHSSSSTIIRPRYVRSGDLAVVAVAPHHISSGTTSTPSVSGSLRQSLRASHRRSDVWMDSALDSLFGTPEKLSKASHKKSTTKKKNVVDDAVDSSADANSIEWAMGESFPIISALMGDISIQALARTIALPDAISTAISTTSAELDALLSAEEALYYDSPTSSPELRQKTVESLISPIVSAGLASEQRVLQALSPRYSTQQALRAFPDAFPFSVAQQKEQAEARLRARTLRIMERMQTQAGSLSEKFYSFDGREVSMAEAALQAAMFGGAWDMETASEASELHAADLKLLGTETVVDKLKDSARKECTIRDSERPRVNLLRRRVALLRGLHRAAEDERQLVLEQMRGGELWMSADLERKLATLGVLSEQKASKRKQSSEKEDADDLSVMRAIMEDVRAEAELANLVFVKESTLSHLLGESRDPNGVSSSVEEEEYESDSEFSDFLQPDKEKQELKSKANIENIDTIAIAGEALALANNPNTRSPRQREVLLRLLHLAQPPLQVRFHSNYVKSRKSIVAASSPHVWMRNPRHSLDAFLATRLASRLHGALPLLESSSEGSLIGTSEAHIHSVNSTSSDSGVKDNEEDLDHSSQTALEPLPRSMLVYRALTLVERIASGSLQKSAEKMGIPIPLTVEKKERLLHLSRLLKEFKQSDGGSDSVSAGENSKESAESLEKVVLTNGFRLTDLKLLEEIAPEDLQNGEDETWYELAVRTNVPLEAAEDLLQQMQVLTEQEKSPVSDSKKREDEQPDDDLFARWQDLKEAFEDRLAQTRYEMNVRLVLSEFSEFFANSKDLKADMDLPGAQEAAEMRSRRLHSIRSQKAKSHIIHQSDEADVTDKNSNSNKKEKSKKNDVFVVSSPAQAVRSKLQSLHSLGVTSPLVAMPAKGTQPLRLGFEFLSLMRALSKSKMEMIGERVSEVKELLYQRKSVQNELDKLLKQREKERIAEIQWKDELNTALEEKSRNVGESSELPSIPAPSTHATDPKEVLSDDISSIPEKELEESVKVDGEITTPTEKERTVLPARLRLEQLHESLLTTLELAEREYSTSSSKPMSVREIALHVQNEDTILDRMRSFLRPVRSAASDEQQSVPTVEKKIVSSWYAADTPLQEQLRIQDAVASGEASTSTASIEAVWAARRAASEAKERELRSKIAEFDLLLGPRPEMEVLALKQAGARIQKSLRESRKYLGGVLQKRPSLRRFHRDFRKMEELENIRRTYAISQGLGNSVSNLLPSNTSTTSSTATSLHSDGEATASSSKYAVPLPVAAELPLDENITSEGLQAAVRLESLKIWMEGKPTGLTVASNGREGVDLASQKGIYPGETSASVASRNMLSLSLPEIDQSNIASSELAEDDVFRGVLNYSLLNSDRVKNLRNSENIDGYRSSNSYLGYGGSAALSTDWNAQYDVAASRPRPSTPFDLFGNPMKNQNESSLVTPSATKFSVEQSIHRAFALLGLEDRLLPASVPVSVVPSSASVRQAIKDLRSFLPLHLLEPVPKSFSAGSQGVSRSLKAQGALLEHAATVGSALTALEKALADASLLVQQQLKFQDKLVKSLEAPSSVSGDEHTGTTESTSTSRFDHERELKKLQKLQKTELLLKDASGRVGKHRKEMSLADRSNDPLPVHMREAVERLLLRLLSVSDSADSAVPFDGLAFALREIISGRGDRATLVSPPSRGSPPNTSRQKKLKTNSKKVKGYSMVTMHQPGLPIDSKLHPISIVHNSVLQEVGGGKKKGKKEKQNEDERLQ